MADSIITPRIVATLLKTGLQKVLGLGEAQCYVTATGGYVDGQSPFVIQIVPGAQPPDGPGNGGQSGGVLRRRLHLSLWCWFRFNLDLHGITQEALVKLSEGLLDQLETLRQTLSLTDLGGSLAETLEYEGCTPAVVFSEEEGVLYSVLTVSGPLIVSLGDTVTITLADLGLA